MNDFRMVGNTLVKYTGNEDHVFVPEGVTVIGGQAFAYHQNLVSVVLPEGVVSIAEKAFDSCVNLTSVTIPSTVSLIDGGAFFGCRSLDHVVIPNGVTFIAAKTFLGCRSLKTITVPETVQMIGDEAFRRCSSLEEMAIGDQITSLGKGAFADCVSLKSCSLGAGIEYLRWNTFYGCLSLEKVSFTKTLREIEFGAFDSCRSLTDVFYSGNERDWRVVGVKGQRNETFLRATYHFNNTEPLIEPDHVSAAELNSTEQLSFDVVEEIPIVEEVKEEAPIEEVIPEVKAEAPVKEESDIHQIEMDLGELSFGKPKGDRKKKPVERKIRTSQKSTASDVSEDFKKEFYESFMATLSEDFKESIKAAADGMTEENFEAQSEALFLVPAQEAYEFGCVCLFMGRYNWAFRSFLSAAGKGILPAQFYVGSCFLYGIDTTKKIVDAARWLTKCKHHMTYGEKAIELLAIVDAELDKPENAGLKIKRGKK